MDWIEILFLLIFFGLPILGQLFGKKEDPSLPPVEDERESHFELPGPTATAPAPAEGGGWSGEWGEWPTEAEEEEEAYVEEGPGLTTREAVSLEPVEPEPLPVRPERAVPVAMPQTVEVLRVVDRKKEHERFHQRLVKVPPAPRPAPASLVGDIRDMRTLRRAVLLAEVLGPPRSLRE